LRKRRVDRFWKLILKRSKLIRVRTLSLFWFPAVAGQGTIRSEDRVAWNFKVPRAG